MLANVESQRFGWMIQRFHLDEIAEGTPRSILKQNPDIAILRFPAAQMETFKKHFSVFSPILADTLNYYELELKHAAPKPAANEALNFRLAQKSDEKEIEQIIARAFAGYRNHYSANPVLDKSKIVEGYAEWGRNLLKDSSASEPFWVAEEAGRVIAFIACRRDGDSLDIALNAVHPDFANKGVYSKLLNFAISEAKKIVPVLKISTQAENQIVQKIWQRAGFYLSAQFKTVHINCFLHSVDKLNDEQNLSRKKIIQFMQGQPILSIAIATFNSERTLSLVLDSVKKQKGLQGGVEILIVDGGSTDSTLSIAKKFQAKIISNPKTEPVHAKFLALHESAGEFLVYLDHDEILQDANSLQRKIDLACEVKIILPSGYISPSKSWLNEYLNSYGEPFTYFVYGISKSYSHFIHELKSIFTVQEENQDHIIYKLKSSLPLIELCAAGALVHKEFIFEKIGKEIKVSENIPHLFYLLAPHLEKIAVLKNDPILHYSVDNLDSYLRKIHWRVKNNIYFRKSLGEAGFSGREKFQPTKINMRKWLYLPYAFSFLLPFVDSLRLSVKNKSLAFLWHLPLTIFTAMLILVHQILFYLGYRPMLRSYDEKVEIGEKRNLLFFMGTAAELIKVFPVLRGLGGTKYEVISSGQAPSSFQSQWKELDLGHYTEISNRGRDLHSGVEALFWFSTTFIRVFFQSEWREKIRGSVLVVHGDTISALLGAILGKCFGAKSIVHLEAGRRSGNLWSPFPEEICRRLVTKLSSLHLAENDQCVKNLSGKVIHTQGNTQESAVSLLTHTTSSLNWKKPYCLLNLHRFENLSFFWNEVIQVTIEAAKVCDAYFICHGHVKQRIEPATKDRLEKLGVKFIDRMSFQNFLSALNEAEFLVTDGSGNQDDIALLGTPTLIVRNEIETKTGLWPNGSALLSGWDQKKIQDFFKNYAGYRKPKKAANPFIVESIVRALESEVR